MSSDNVTTKLCPKCDEYLPTTSEFFNKDNSKKDKLCSYCKICSKNKSKEWTNDNLELNRDRARQWSRDNPERNRQRAKDHYWSNPEKHRTQSKEYQHSHKDELRERRREYQSVYKRSDKYKKSQQEYRKRERERMKLYNQQYKKDHPGWANEVSKNYREKFPEKATVAIQRRLARKYNLPNTLIPDQWAACLTYFNNCCVYCGKHSIKLHMEHVIPLANLQCPGTVQSNILPACQSCNSSKGDKDFKFWLYNKVTQSTYERICTAIDRYMELK